MSFWSFLQGKSLATTSIVTPYKERDSTALVQLLAADLFPDTKITTIDRASALKIPGVKRAHGIHTHLIGGLSFFQNIGDDRDDEQPEWLTNSASGVPLYQRWAGLTSDLFFDGWGCLAFNDDKTDAVHVPAGLWGIADDTNLVWVTDQLPENYRRNPIAISMGYGENGILVDGSDTLAAAVDLQRAWMERVKNPSPATELHFTDPAYDDLGTDEKRKIVDGWNENRRRDGGQTAVTQSFVEVKDHGVTSADLFEKGRNANRLDLANHSAVPASIIEGAKDGGGGDITYSNVDGGAQRNEL